MTETPAWKKLAAEVRAEIEAKKGAAPKPEPVAKAHATTTAAAPRPSIKANPPHETAMQKKRRAQKPVKFRTHVKSASGRSDYRVIGYEDGSYWCSCLAWKNNHASPQHRHCKHTRQVQRERQG